MIQLVLYSSIANPPQGDNLDRCVDEATAALGMTYVVMRLRHSHSGGPPHREIMKSIELLGSQVVPQLS